MPAPIYQACGLIVSARTPANARLIGETSVEALCINIKTRPCMDGSTEFCTRASIGLMQTGIIAPPRKIAPTATTNADVGVKPMTRIAAPMPRIPHKEVCMRRLNPPQVLIRIPPTTTPQPIAAARIAKFFSSPLKRVAARSDRRWNAGRERKLTNVDIINMLTEQSTGPSRRCYHQRDKTLKIKIQQESLCWIMSYIGQEGVEPTRYHYRRILSPLRLPFRHYPERLIILPLMKPCKETDS